MFRSGRPERLEDVDECCDCVCDCDCDCTVLARELRLGGEFPAIACHEGCVGERREAGGKWCDAQKAVPSLSNERLVASVCGGRMRDRKSREGSDRSGAWQEW